jgi:hypothetical protein
MKPMRPLLVLLGSGLLFACDSSEPESGQAPATAPPSLSAEDRQTIEGQKIGSKLLGAMVRLEGDEFKPADPGFVPEAYFIYYSASW